VNAQTVYPRSMLYQNLSAAVYGIDASIIEVEVDVSGIECDEEHCRAARCGGVRRNRVIWRSGHSRDLKPTIGHRISASETSNITCSCGLQVIRRSIAP
jgi:hypothetical protein